MQALEALQNCANGEDDVLLTRDALAALRTALEQPEQECWCHKCNENRLVNNIPFSATRMILCPTCGNKRCPKASDHCLDCTDSNEPNQPGSLYTTLPAAQPEQEPVAIPDCGEAGHADGACGTSECLPSFRRKTTPPAAQAAPVQEPVVFYRCNGCGHAYEQVHPTSCDCMDAGGFDRVEYFTTPPAAQPEPVEQSLNDAVFTVLEGFTLPHDVRKILEAAYYTTPPAAQRKSLTDDQLDEIAVIARRGNLHDLRIAIEAKLKERNNG
jgi:hypothetical protein